MTAHDIYLIAPEIALAAVGGAVVVLDLLLRDKRLLPLIAVLGLLVPVGFAVVLWIDVSAESSGALTGLFDTVVVDKFALFFKFLVLSIVALVVLGSRDFADRFHRSQGEFYGIILLSAVGMMLVAATKELVSIYISLELATLPIAALAAFMRDERSSEAGLKFLLLSAVSSALLLYGMVLVYAFTGSTHLDVIASSVSSGSVPFGSNVMLVGITLIVVGFGFKISMVPFQMWVPDVYEGSPTPVAAFLSVASKAAGFAVVLRVFYVAFGSVDVDWSILFAVLAVLSMTVGNLVAILQNNVKRLLGYSTIAQAGIYPGGGSRRSGKYARRRRRRVGAKRCAVLSGGLRRHQSGRFLCRDGHRQPHWQRSNRRPCRNGKAFSRLVGCTCFVHDIADRNSAHSRLHGQAVSVQRGGKQ